MRAAIRLNGQSEGLVGRDARAGSVLRDQIIGHATVAHIVAHGGPREFPAISKVESSGLRGKGTSPELVAANAEDTPEGGAIEEGL